MNNISVVNELKNFDALKYTADIYFNSREGYYTRSPRMIENEHHFLLSQNANNFLSPKIIECSIQFIQIGEVDTMNEKYQAIIQIKAKWYVDEDITEYDAKKNWNPKLFVENSSHDKYQEEISYTVKKIFEKTMVTETRIAKGYFWERMELNDFPLDIQDLTVCLSSKHPPHICKLIADPNKFTLINNEKYSALSQEVVKSFRDQQKFDLYELIKFEEKASYEIDSKKQLKRVNRNRKTKFVAVCRCSRKPMFYVINAYLFNLLITVLSMTLFAIDSKMAQNRISGTFTLILTSFSFKVVTSKSLPTIAYLTSLDKYQLINIVYLALCCVWHSFCASLNIDEKQKHQLDKIALYSFASFFFTIQVIFTIILMQSYRKKIKCKRDVIRLLKLLDPITLEDDDSY